MRHRYLSLFYLGLGLAGLPGVAAAHGPLFSFSPHTEYKDALEYHLGYEREERAGVADNEYTAEFKYGLTSDWTLGAELPYENGENTGIGDAGLKTKYRFWRSAAKGELRSLTLVGDLKFDTGSHGAGTGSTDAITGLAYGYESIEWYRWASVGYRYNGEGDDGLQRGGRVLLNLAGGWRPRTPEYHEPDLVFVTELNAEITARAERNGRDLADTGGTEVFVSPGMIWTSGHLNIRAGVQIPLYHNLNGDQTNTDFRARLEIEMHY